MKKCLNWDFHISKSKQITIFSKRFFRLSDWRISIIRPNDFDYPPMPCPTGSSNDRSSRIHKSPKLKSHRKFSQTKPWKNTKTEILESKVNKSAWQTDKQTNKQTNRQMTVIILLINQGAPISKNSQLWYREKWTEI